MQDHSDREAELSDIASRFAADTYLLRRKFFRIFGGGFHLYGPDGELRLYTEMKRFRLKEDIRLYSDESMDTEILQISTKSIFDISGSYAVRDTVNDELVGGLRRKGLKSFFKDEWLILDAQGVEIGTIREDGTLRALARRAHEFVSMLLPQGFHVEVGGTAVATFKQQFNPIVQKLDLDFSADTTGLLDRRLGVAAAVLILAIEGKQG